MALVGKENRNHNQDSNKEDQCHQINMQKFKTGLFEYLLEYFQCTFLEFYFFSIQLKLTKLQMAGDKFLNTNKTDKVTNDR